MTTQEVLLQMTNIYRDVMDNDDIVLSPATKAEDIEEWDSLMHIQLIVAIEKYFKIRFNSAEINAFKTVGEMCESISAKLSK